MPRRKACDHAPEGSVSESAVSRNTRSSERRNIPGAGRPEEPWLCKLPLAQSLQLRSVRRQHRNSFEMPHFRFLIRADSVWVFSFAVFLTAGDSVLNFVIIKTAPIFGVKGEPMWGLPVTQGETFYLCLEDSERRIQERLNTITDDVPPGLYFATGSTSIESGVCDWIRKFKHEHPAVTFVAIDTFQLIRTPTGDVSYGNDYAELQPLRALAEELKICLLLVHHLRKMGDKDPINKLSGSTGIAGAVDAIYVLEKNERIENSATLYASGRDIRDRKMKLEMEPVTCTWQLLSDSLTMPETVMPDEMTALVTLMKATLLFNGSNTDLASALSATLGREITAKGMKQMMNRWRFQMEALGVYFESRRSSSQKYIRVKYVSPQPTESASSDPSASTSSALISFVPCDPCVPA